MRFKSGLTFAGLMWMNLAQADILGVRIGVDYTEMSPSIVAGDAGQAGHLTLSDDRVLNWAARFEHPLPLLPNIAARYQRSGQHGQSALPATLTLSGKTFTSGSNTAQFNSVQIIDISAYYELLDNPVASLDVGITARNLKSDTALSTNMTSAEQGLNVHLPMLFVDAELGIWGTDTVVFMQGNYSKYQGDQNYDWRSGVAWRLIDITMLQVYVRAGWQRSVSLVSNRDHIDLRATNNGGFVGINFDF